MELQTAASSSGAQLPRKQAKWYGDNGSIPTDPDRQENSSNLEPDLFPYYVATSECKRVNRRTSAQCRCRQKLRPNMLIVALARTTLLIPRHAVAVVLPPCSYPPWEEGNRWCMLHPPSAEFAQMVLNPSVIMPCLTSEKELSLYVSWLIVGFTRPLLGQSKENFMQCSLPT